MAVLTIRGLDDEVRHKLRLRAAEHGRSMEAEARAILTEAVTSPVERTLVDVLLQMRQALGGLELEIPPRADHPRDPFA
jgi:plasmid stability protein